MEILKELCEEALNCLSDTLRFELFTEQTHCYIKVEDINDSKTKKYLSIYLVNIAAQLIQINLDIWAGLFDEKSCHLDVRKSLTNIIGEDNSICEQEKTTKRNPWILECISHLLLNLVRSNSVICDCLLPYGRLHGLEIVHKSANEPGLDLIGLYETDSIGICIGETKAYEKSPSKGLKDAFQKFHQVENGDYDSDIRAFISNIRYSLDREIQNKISGSFWRNERRYYPTIGYSNERKPRWNQNREYIKSLEISCDKKIIIPLSICDFRDFFDDIAENMRLIVLAWEGGQNVQQILSSINEEVTQV